MQRIKGFDGLRAIAVVMVFLTHKTSFGGQTGEYGVHLFFVLSGFLIIGILHRQREGIEAGGTGVAAAMGRFYLNRAVRVWPLYFLIVGLLLAAGVAGVRRALTPDEIVALLTFTMNYFVGHVWEKFPGIYAPLWSVAVEEQFYLWIAPLLLLAPARWAWWLCLATVGGALGYGVHAHLAGASHLVLYVSSLTNFGLMALGGLAVLSRSQPRLLAVAAPWLFAAFLMASVATWYVPGDWILATALFWLTPLLVVSVLKGIAERQDSLFVHVLEVAPLRYLGKISYGFYMFHGFTPVLHKHLGPFAEVADFALIVVLASVSWKFLEEPLLRWRDRFHGRHAAGALSGTVPGAEGPNEGLPRAGKAPLVADQAA